MLSHRQRRMLPAEGFAKYVTHTTTKLTLEKNRIRINGQHLRHHQSAEH